MAKEIFNTTEKSNFILNLTEEGFSKMAAIGLVTACFASSLGTIFPLATGGKNYALTAAGLSVAGVICMIIAIIGGIKKYIKGRTIVPMCILGALLVWTTISALVSNDIAVGFYGFPGRGEGLLAFIFYGCFFAAAVSIKRENALKTFIFGIIGSGLLSSIVSLVQIFGGVFTEYKLVGYGYEVNAASGLCQSPMFLAMLLTIAIAAALMGVALFEKKGQKIFCIISAALFSFVIMFTYSLIGICGLALAVIGAAVLIIGIKAPKVNLLSVLAVILPAAAAVLIVQGGMIGNISEYRLYDGRILWFSDSYMRLSASGMHDPDLIDIDDTEEVYYTINRKTMDIISKYGAFGTGPDQLVYPQIYTVGGLGDDATVEDVAAFNKGTFDRTYNEYLYTAATRGIPTAFLFAALLGTVLIAGISAVKKSKNGYTFAMVILTATGALIFLISCTNTAFSPIFWGIAGCACANISAKETAPEKAEKPEKSEKPEKPEKPEKTGDPKKSEKSGKTEKAKKSAKSAKSGKSKKK